MAYVKESAMQLMNDIANDPRVLVERTMDMPFQIRRYASFVAKKKNAVDNTTKKQMVDCCVRGASVSYIGGNIFDSAVYIHCHVQTIV